MNSLKKSIMGKYNAEDVDMLLKKVRDDYELCLKNQKERIVQLREENRELSNMLEMYKNNERYISNVMTRAEETAQSILQQAQTQAKQKLEQARSEARQYKAAEANCFKRLMGLRNASESIFKTVAQILELNEPEKSNVSLFTGRDTLV